MGRFLKTFEYLSYKRWLKRYHFKRRWKYVIMYGPEALSVFSQIASRLNINYSLMYGTLLGAYRENGFIYRDNDIDIAVEKSYITKHLLSEMQKKGFSIDHSMVSDDKTRLHIAFDYKKLKFDIYSYCLNDNGYATCSIPRPINNWDESYALKKARVLNITFPYKGYKEILFVGTNVKIWNNVEEVLTINYGEDYMTPIKGRKAKTNDNVWFDPIEKRYFIIMTKEELLTYLPS